MSTPEKRIAIIQPNYIPWRGYFDFISKVDVFVFLDNVQYTTRDWRNRNKILSPQGKPIWLSVPIVGGRNQLISEVAIDNSQAWNKKHSESFKHSYGRCSHFEEVFSILKPIFESPPAKLLDLDVTLIKIISNLLGIKTEFFCASHLTSEGAKEAKLISIVKDLQGTHYLSGPAAKAYIDPTSWQENSITLEYMDYPEYPAYTQISPVYEPFVSILDLLFMMGNRKAGNFIWPNKIIA